MDSLTDRLRPLSIGVFLALLAIAFGFGMGAAFGAAEDALKGGLAADGAAALDTLYGGDKAAMDAVVKKSWVYYKRAHLHANALGTTALACILLLAALGAPRVLDRIAAISFGAGALLYGLYWLAAGTLAPGMGGTGAAKESLAIIAIPGSGLCIVGLALTLYRATTTLFTRPSASS